jgi:hypothetical protein
MVKIKTFTDQQMIKLTANLAKRLSKEQKIYLANELFGGYTSNDSEGHIILFTGIKESELE